MTIQSTQLFGMLGDKMSWLAQRQRVVAQNIANSDTPRYQASDLKPLEFSRAMRLQTQKLQMAATNAQHLQANEQTGAYKSKAQRMPYETTPSGNGVVLEEQMVKMNDTFLQYDLSTSIFKKYTTLYKVALGRN